MASKLNEEQQELLEDLADSVEKTNNRVSSLEQKVDDLISLLKKEKDDQKDADQQINKELVKNAFFEYFSERDTYLSTVRMDLTDENITKLVDGIYEGLMRKITEQNKEEKAKYQAREQKDNELRKQQGIASSAQIAEWAPEYPEALRNLLYYFAQRLFLTTAKPELVHEVTKIIGDTLMVCYREQFSWRAMVSYYREKVGRFLSNWKLVTLSICLNAAIIFIGCMAIYHSKVVDADMRNQIIDYYWKNDYFRNKDIQAIDSILKQKGHYDAIKWVDSH